MKFLRSAAFSISVLLLMTTAARAADDRPTTRAEVVPSDDKLTLAFPGIKGAISYEKFGSFDNLGGPKFRYIITSQKDLMEAAGEGIFPNRDVQKDPAYKELVKSGALTGSQWNFVDGNTAAKNFYKWASVNEDPGVKQFFVALMLERAGLLPEAIKALYAVALHFPKTVSYTYYDTPWYVAPAALDRVEELLRRHPAIPLVYEPGRIAVANRYDTDLKNDVYAIDPGRLVDKSKAKKVKPVRLDKLKVVKTVGGPHVQLKKYENGHWQLFVDGKPFPIRALTYSVTPIGVSPDRGTWNVSKDWQLIDTDKDGRHDGFDQSYIDTNGDGVQDADEPTVGDGKILKDLGVNTLRAYHHLYNKDLFRRLYKEYGFYVLCGDLLGGYAVGSGASWTDGTNYSDPKQQDLMLASVREMVEEYKDEPYVLMWVLGNENVYGVANNANKDPDAYFKFVNRAAELIHQLDPTRPVVHANGDLLYIDIFKRDCPAVDVFGANVYRGEQGFGRSLFEDAKDAVDRPVLITEYGACAYGDGYTTAQAEAYQAMYIGNNWEDLEANMAGHGAGNALGGVLFEYMDEWWKANSDLPEKVQKAKADWYASRSATYKNLQPDRHDTVPQFGFPMLDGWSYEEWFGLVSQGDGKGSPFARTLRPSYFTVKKMWNP